MLKELHISNYRLFDELLIPDLGQVNLIAGKNNTGKTALLEALRIWAAKGDSTVINHTIAQRGQFNPGWGESYESLFQQNSLLSQQNGDDLSLVINELTIQRHKSENYRSYCQLLWERKDVQPNLNPSTPSDNPNDRCAYVPFSNGNFFPLQRLWDKIALTPLQKEVEDILRLVEKRVVQLDVREESNRSRVLLEGDSEPILLKSLGDGINRMLWVAVALVSAKESKLLLIDEFEAGLHHSVQEMLWEKIFFYAKEWSIQVFATTHSMDTVRTFYYVAARPENEGMGKYFRLQRSRKGQIEVKTYDEERLEKVLELKMELR